jgi:hypothetical protein
LQNIVDALNGKQLFSIEDGEEFGDYEQKLRETPPILKELVEAWQRSGPDLEKFYRDWPTVWANVTRYWKATPVELSWGPSGGACLVHRFTDRPGRTPLEEAFRFFILLIMNPKWDKLAGPCAGCGAYYMRRTARNSTYCTRRCATRTTAIAATRKRRDEERAEKLRKATQLSQQWLSARTKQDWKPWISRREPEITIHWLTRAVNQGDLKPPVRN